MDEIEQLFLKQLSVWELAKNNYEALNHLKVKELNVNNCAFIVQYNPARIISSGAKVDAESIEKRKCFLCEENLPKEQMKIVFKGKYSIMVNPFPIFTKHFTISENSHVPQAISSRFGDMFDLAKIMNEYVIFYNGPKCGASAPDHAHFQAGSKGFLPLEENWRKHISKEINENLFVVNYGFYTLFIETDKKRKTISLFEKIYNKLEVKNGDSEPMMNILTWYENKKWIIAVVPRSKHRPDCFFADGERNFLVSPASVDLGGVFITPLEKDFERISEKNIEEILNEVCFTKKNFKKIIEKLQAE